MHIISSFYEYHDLSYKIFRIGGFRCKTLISCLVELPGNKKNPKGISLGKKNNTITQTLGRLW